MSSSALADPVAAKLLYVQSQVRRMRCELAELELTPNEATLFHGALMIIEQRARHLFLLAAVRKYAH